MMIPSRLVTRRWLVDVTVMAAGAVAIGMSWILMSSQLSRGDALQDGVLALALIGGVILAHRYPLQAPGQSRLDASLIPLFLMAALLPIPLAITAIGLGKLVGEVMRRRGSSAGFTSIATDAGRWVLVGLAASLVAHTSSATGSLQLLVLLGSAAVFWFGDGVTTSLIAWAARCQSPMRIIAAMAQESGLLAAALYLVGVLGALAATRSLVAVLLVFAPIALGYRALRRTIQLDRGARQLLGMVGNASSDAVLLLDTRGRILSANRNAAALYSRSDADSAPGMSVAELVIPEDQHRIRQDLRRALLGNKVAAAEYTVRTRRGAAFAVDIESSSALDAESGSCVVMCVMRDITEHKRVEKVHTHHALNDSLTGLPGRALLLDRLEQCLARARREANPFAVGLLDLNQLERINDTSGHRVGDLVLQQVGRRLRGTLRDSDTVARLGGDDFAVVLPAADEKGALLVADRLMRILNEPYSIDDQVLEVATSMGIALYPDHGNDGSELMQRADAAMRIAKMRGSGYSLFEADRSSIPSNDSISVETRRGLEAADHV